MNAMHPRFKPVNDTERADWRRLAFRALYPSWTRLGLANRLKRRRVALIDAFLDGALTRARRILDVGCANGQDFVLLLPETEAQVYGLDIEAYSIQKRNFSFVRCDADHIDFPDGYFDVAVSIGVFEHIQPIEKLCRAASEIGRISKAFCVVVPSVGTILEPHSAQLFWHLKDHNRKHRRPNLNYFSDDAWLKFEGFKGCKSKRFWYIPGLVQDLAIYRSGS